LAVNVPSGTGRKEAEKAEGAKKTGTKALILKQIESVFDQLRRLAERRGDSGVRQREFPHQLYVLAEQAIQSSN
jgi:hypothetical protein